MSAPDHVYRVELEDGEPLPDYVVVNDTRYLRADLTCGECRCLDESDYWEKCPNDYVGEKTPACMAFVPKEGK